MLYMLLTSTNASTEVDKVLRTVFKRCVQGCSDASRLSCSAAQCKDDEICVLVPATCDECAHLVCRPSGIDSSGGQDKDSGPNVGAIAGGVIGGVAFVAILTFIVWKFCLRGRRRKIDPTEWQEPEYRDEKPENDFVSRRSTRASTHTVASMASSVLTRASNIIQIAYIPGVTNRSGPGSPDLLVPPVPPIPAMSPSTGMNSPYSTSEQHFFLPGDFRDSMASTTTDGRSSYARTSIAPSLLPRGSVASTVYRQNAIVSPLPAQTIVRGKAAVVSVKSSCSNSPAETPNCETPPVPQIDPKHTVQPVRIQMPASSSEIGRKNSVRTAAQIGGVRALTITKKKKETSPDATPSLSSGASSITAETAVTPGESTIRPVTDISLTTDDGQAHARARRAGGLDSDSDSDNEEEHSRAKRSLLRDSDTSDASATPTSVQSPFSDQSAIDPAARPEHRRQTSSASALRPPMTPIAEESSKRASRTSKRAQSPFSDDNKSDLA